MNKNHLHNKLTESIDVMIYPRISFLHCLIGFVLCVSGTNTLMAQSSESKPNVLFISIDDLNDWPRFMGRYPDAITPNMDRLAEQGVVFTNAHCTYPLCGPSRASIFSGLSLPLSLIHI